MRCPPSLECGSRGPRGGIGSIFGARFEPPVFNHLGWDAFLFSVALLFFARFGGLPSSLWTRICTREGGRGKGKPSQLEDSKSLKPKPPQPRGLVGLQLNLTTCRKSCESCEEDSTCSDDKSIKDASGFYFLCMSNGRRPPRLCIAKAGGGQAT